jgi:hypothetical protein
MTAHVPLPTRRILRRAIEVARAKNCRVQVNQNGGVELITQFGTVLDQRGINALAREIELQEEQGTAA